MLLIWNKVTKSDKITNKQPKVIIYLLTVLFSELKDSYKIYDDKKFINKFFDYFKNVYNYDYEEKDEEEVSEVEDEDKMDEVEDDNEDGEPKIRLKLGNKFYTYKDLLGNMLINLDVLDKVKYLVKFELIPMLKSEKTIIPINTEEFTLNHRKEYIGKNKLKKDNSFVVIIRTNNPELSWFPGKPEFKEVSITEAFSGRYWLDHIIPKSKNGETTIENAELTSEEYNRKKYNKEV